MKTFKCKIQSQNNTRNDINHIMTEKEFYNILTKKGFGVLLNKTQFSKLFSKSFDARFYNIMVDQGIISEMYEGQKGKTSYFIPWSVAWDTYSAIYHLGYTNKDGHRVRMMIRIMENLNDL